MVQIQSWPLLGLPLLQTLLKLRRCSENNQGVFSRWPRKSYLVLCQTSPSRFCLVSSIEALAIRETCIFCHKTDLRGECVLKAIVVISLTGALPTTTTYRLPWEVKTTVWDIRALASKANFSFRFSGIAANAATNPLQN